MDIRLKRILISAGLLVGVVFIMCLAAKVMMQSDSGLSAEVSSESKSGSSEMTAKGITDKDTAGEDTGSTAAGTTATDSADGAGSGSGTSGSGTGSGTSGSSESDSGSSGESGSTAGDISASGNGESGSGTSSTSGAGIGSNGTHVVVINAAHQSKYSSETEAIGPGAATTKVKAITGATGVKSGTPEYKINLEIAGLLRDELISRGYEVYMIRESNDVDISDAERAQIANKQGEIVIHIHCNADDAEGIKGIMAFYPSKDNAYVGNLSDSCKALSTALLTGLEAATADKNWGPIALDNQTALNWTKIPASHVEVGYLSNIEEDALLQTEEYRTKIARGLADGVDMYFGQ